MLKRLAALLLAIFTLVAVTGCAVQPAAVDKNASPAPAAQAAPAPAPAPVDKGAILKEAAVKYFNTLPANSNLMEAKDLKAKVDAKDAGIFLLDIRRPEDFAKGHIDGATNIGFAALGANIDKLPKDKQVVIMCYSGQTAGQAIGVLKMAGFNAVSLKGGFPSWEKEKFPVTQ